MEDIVDVQNEVALLHIVSSIHDKANLEKHNSDQVCGFLHSPANEVQQLYCNYCHYGCGLDQVLVFLEHLEQHLFRCQFCSFQTFSHSQVLLHVQKIHKEFSQYDEISLCTLFDVAKKTDFENESSIIQQDIKTDQESFTRNSCQPVFQNPEETDNCTNIKDEVSSYDRCVEIMGSLISSVKHEPNLHVTENSETQCFNEPDYPIKPLMQNDTCVINSMNGTKAESAHQDFTCLICDKYFPTLRALCSHKRLHSRMKEFVCNICGFRCDSQVKIHQHRKIHSDLFACDICGKRLPQKCFVRRHKKSKHGIIEPYVRPGCKCLVCGECFPNRELLTLHEKSHKQFSCKICGLNYESKELLLNHKKDHQKVPYPCDICGQVVRRSQIKSHRLSAHGAQPYKCEDCGKTFAKRKYLIAHKKLHQGEGQCYMCEVCGKRYTFLTGLLNHKRRGHDFLEENAYLCGVCGKQCKHQAGLTLHMKVHNRNKNHNPEYGNNLKSEDDIRQPENNFSGKHGIKKPSSLKKHKHNFKVCDVCGKRVKFISIHKYRVHNSHKQLRRCYARNSQYPYKKSFRKYCQMNFRTQKSAEHNTDKLETVIEKCMMHKDQFTVSSTVKNSTIKNYDGNKAELEAMLDDKKKTYKCKYCNRIFKFKNCLVNHHRKKHRNKKVTVKNNDKFIAEHPQKFQPKYEPTMTRAKAKNAKVKIQPQSKCKEKLPFKNDFKLKRTNNLEHRCNSDNCDKSFVNKNNLTKHKLTHTQEKLFQCKYCNKMYVKSALRKHYKCVHNIKDTCIISERNHEFIQFEKFG